MRWELRITRSARRELEDAPTRDSARLEQAVATLADDPYAGDVQKIKGGRGNRYRKRVGSWRILYAIETGERRVVVHGVVRRTSTTY